MDGEVVLLLERANLGSPQTPSTHNSLVPSVPVNFFEHGAICWEVVWQEVEKRSKIGPEKVGKWLENGRKMVFGRKMVEKWSENGRPCGCREARQRSEKGRKKVPKRS